MSFENGITKLYQGITKIELSNEDEQLTLASSRLKRNTASASFPKMIYFSHESLNNAEYKLGITATEIMKGAVSKYNMKKSHKDNYEARIWLRNTKLALITIVHLCEAESIKLFFDNRCRMCVCNPLPPINLIMSYNQRRAFFCPRLVTLLADLAIDLLNVYLA